MATPLRLANNDLATRVVTLFLLLQWKSKLNCEITRRGNHRLVLPSAARIEPASDAIQDRLRMAAL
jgi:hypothetical protein